jgi:hypothetical protein
MHCGLKAGSVSALPRERAGPRQSAPRSAPRQRLVPVTSRNHRPGGRQWQCQPGPGQGCPARRRPTRATVHAEVFPAASWSPATITRWRGNRSATTPPSSRKTITDASIAAVTYPTSAAEPPTDSTANGTATIATALPVSDTTLHATSSRKLRLLRAPEGALTRFGARAGAGARPVAGSPARAPRPDRRQAPTARARPRRRLGG